MYDFTQPDQLEIEKYTNQLESSAGLVYGSSNEPNRSNISMKKSVTSKFKVLGQSVNSLKEQSSLKPQESMSKPKLSLNDCKYILIIII